MTEMTYNGEPLEVEKVSFTLPVSREWVEDLPRMRWQQEALFATFTGELPLTDEEKRTGWKEFTSSDGITGRVAVGWRAEQMAKEAEVARQKAMAACPYVECTCGYHED